MRSKEQKIEYAKRKKDKYLKLKTIVYNHYGWLCSCCGESEHMFLSIDHTNNDGNKEREVRGIPLYQKIIREGFPDTYQVWCMNCNHGKSRNKGICPHNIV